MYNQLFGGTSPYGCAGLPQGQPFFLWTTDNYPQAKTIRVAGVVRRAPTGVGKSRTKRSDRGGEVPHQRSTPARAFTRGQAPGTSTIERGMGKSRAPPSGRGWPM